MGQKINPNIYRLGINKTWNTEFFEKKNQEFPTHTFKDIAIKDYIERFLETKNLLLHDYKLHYSNSTLNIYVSYFITPNFIFDKTTNSKKKITIIKKTDVFKKLKKNLSSAITKKNAKKVLFLYNSHNKRKTISNLNLKQNLRTSNVLRFLDKNKKYLGKTIYAYKQDILRTNKNNTVFTGTNKNREISDYSKFKSLKNLSDLSLKNSFNDMLKSLSLFTQKQYHIITTFQCINKKFNLTLKQQQSLKEKFMLLQRFKNNLFFTESIDALFISVNYKNSANLIAKLIASQFKKVKRHKAFLAFLKKTLTLFVTSNFSQVKGIKIIVKGRLNGAPRAKHKILTMGSVPTQTISSNLNYSQSTCHNANGSYGIKVWVIEKN